MNAAVQMPLWNTDVFDSLLTRVVDKLRELRKPRASIPALAPVAVQLPLVTPAVRSLQAQIDRLCMCDALVFGATRLEYVVPESGQSTLRLYRGGRVIGVARVYNEQHLHKLKQQVVGVLWALGCDGECSIECGAAYFRRKLRRKVG